MQENIRILTKDLEQIDLKDIFSDWQWLLDTQKEILIISCIGDMFLLGKDNTINWLEVGTAELNTVAENLEEFKKLLNEQENIDNWFMPDLINNLVNEGKTLNEHQVYSYKVIPGLGGDYSSKNFEVTDISVHFSYIGQIHQQIWDLPDGTIINSVNIDPPAGL